MLLEHVKGITPDTELEAEYNNLVEQTNRILSQLSTIMEAPQMAEIGDRLAGGQAPHEAAAATPAPGNVQGGEDVGDALNALDTVMQQLDAAKRGLGLVNKLADSPSRTRNRSRVMGNLNKIRGNLRRVEKMISDIVDNDFELKSELNYDAKSMAG